MQDLETLTHQKTQVYSDIEQRFDSLFDSRDAEEQEELKKRLKEAKASEKNAQKPSQDDVIVKHDPNLYYSRLDIQKIMQTTQGIDFVMITDPASPMLPRAYWFAAQYFPTNEIDPQAVWEETLERTREGIVLAETPRRKSFFKAVHVAAVDREGIFGKSGEIIGEFDGIFEASKEANTLYSSHAAVTAEARRKGIGSALLNAGLAASDLLIPQAEEKLDTVYKVNPKTGRKVQSVLAEIEFASLADEESLRTTIGRLVFHGVNGCGVCGMRKFDGGVRYLQSDTEYDQESPYNRKVWTSVPMYFGIRLIGNEDRRTITGREAKAFLDLIYDGFLVQGMNPEGVNADRAYSQRNIKAGGNVDFYALPTTLREAAEFIGRQGECYHILRSVYPGHNFTRKNAEEVMPTITFNEMNHLLRE